MTQDQTPSSSLGRSTDRSSSSSLRDVCFALLEKVDAFLAETLDAPALRKVQAQVGVSMGIIEEALERYSSDQISISYNGGKDCLVLLVLLLAAFARRLSRAESSSSRSLTAASTNGTHPTQPTKNTLPSKLHGVYIVSTHPFPEIDDFVESSSADYKLDISRYTLPMKQGLEAFLSQNPAVEAVFVGTRRTDPHGENLKHFDPTDAGWPALMRIHPVIDWHYAEIWAFIRHLQIPYCPLYDKGYTSLGGKLDTNPNPRLKTADRTSSHDTFRPAYELTEDGEERLGRPRR